MADSDRYDIEAVVTARIEGADTTTASLRDIAGAGQQVTDVAGEVAAGLAGVGAAARAEADSGATATAGARAQAAALAQLRSAAEQALTILRQVQAAQAATNNLVGSMPDMPTTSGAGAAAAAAQTEELIAVQARLQAALGATATATAVADAATANVAPFAERADALDADVAAYERAADAARLFEAASAAQDQIAAPAVTTAGAANTGQVDAEAAAVARLRAELLALDAARQADATAAAGEAEAQERLLATLSSLAGQTTETSMQVEAERQGAAAVATLNSELEIRNALIQAGVAQYSLEGEFVTLNQEGAAAVREQVAALQAEQAELQKVRGDLAAVGAAEESTGAAGVQEAGLLTRAFEEVGQALKYIVVYGALIGLIQDFGGAVTAAIAFEDSLVRLETLVGINVTEVNSYRDAIRSVSLATGQSANDNAQAMFAITSAGVRGQAALDALKASAEGAAIGLGDQTTVARAAVSAMVAYGQGNLSAKQALDVIIATAREGNVPVEQLAGAFGRVTGIASTVGVSFANVGAAIASMTRMGVSADEAVTGLRGTLSALSLKEAKSAEPALKAVGLSVQGLRDMIQKEGLAQALVTLVQRFDGNNDALAKVIPNIRALAEVLGNAKSQAGEYIGIQDRINSSIGTATDKAFALEQANPAFVFKQLGAAAEEAGLDLVRSLLPQLLELSQYLRQVVASGDFSGFGEVLAGAFQLVVAVIHVLVTALQNLPTLLAAWVTWTLAAAGAQTVAVASTTTMAAGMFAFAEGAQAAAAAQFEVAAGSSTLAAGFLAAGAAAAEGGAAEGFFAVAGNAVALTVDRITAAIAANPFGAIAVAVLVAVTALNHLVTQSAAVDAAFEADVAAANKDTIALAELAKQYDVVSQKRGMIQGPAKQTSGNTIGTSLTLSSDAGSFLGELNKINAAYAAAADTAGKDKTALAAAGIARDRDLQALQAHTQGLLDNTKAWLANQDAVSDDMDKQLAAARQEQQTAQSNYNNVSGDHTLSNDYKTAARANLTAATSDVNQLSSAVAVHNARVSTAAQVVPQLQGALDRSRVVTQAATAATNDNAKALAAAEREVNNSITLGQVEAQSKAKIAAAELRGAGAVEQATAAAAANKAVEEARQKLAKAGGTLSAGQEAAIRSYTAAITAATQVENANKAVRASSLALEETYASDIGKVTDAVNGNNFASTEQAELRKAQIEIDKLGNAATEDVVQSLLDDAQARADDINETTAQIAVVKENLANVIAEREARAALTDAVNHNAVASSQLKILLQAEKDAREQLIDATDEEVAAFIKEDAARLQGIEGIKDETVARQQLTKYGWDEAKAQAEVADLQKQLGLRAQVPAAVAKIITQYGGQKSAVEAVTIAEEIEQQVVAAGAQADVDAITKRVTAHHKLLDTYSQEKTAMAEQATAVKTVSDAEVSSITKFSDIMLQVFSGQKVQWGSLVSWMVDTWIKALIQMAAAARAANLAGAAGGAGSGAAGATGAFGLSTGGQQAVVGAGAGVGGAIGGSIGGQGGAIAGAAFGVAATAWVIPVYGWIISVVAAAIGVIATIVTSIMGNVPTWAKIDVGVKNGQVAVVQLRGVQLNLARLDPIANALVSGVNSIVSALGGIIGNASGTLETIGRTGHGDKTNYFVQYANGLVANFGTDYQSAMDFAMVQALKAAPIQGLDPLTLAVIQNTMATTVDDLQKQIQVATQINQLGEGQTTLSFQGIITNMNGLRAAISALVPPSQVLTDALNKIGAAEQQQITALRNSILGISETPKQQLDDSISQFNQAIQDEIATLKKNDQLAIDNANAAVAQAGAASGQIQAAQGQMTAAHMVMVGGNDALAAAIANRDAAKQQLAAATAQQQGDQAFITWLGQQTITAAEQSTAERNLNKQSAASSGSDAAQQKADLTRQIAEAGMTSAAQAFAQIVDNFNQVIASIKALHLSSKESADLMAEAAANEAKALAALKAQYMSSIQSFITEGTNPLGASVASGIQQIRDQAKQMRQDLAAMLAAGQITEKQYQALMGGVNASAGAQLQQQVSDVMKAVQSFSDAGSNGGAGLGDLAGQLQQVDDSADQLKANLQALAAAGLISAQQLAASTLQIDQSAAAQKQYLAQQDANTALDNIYNLIGDTADAKKLEYEMQLAELEAKKAELAAAVAQGLIAQSILDDYNKALNTYIAQGPGGQAAPFTGEDPTAVAQDKAMVAGTTYQDPTQLLQQYEQSNAQTADTLTTEISKINSDFATLRAALGNTAEVQTAYAQAVQSAITKFLDPIIQLQQSLTTGDLSALSPTQKLQADETAFQQAMAQFRAGDMSVLSNLPDIVNTLLKEAQTDLPTGSQSYQQIFQQVQAFLNEVIANAPGYAGVGTAPAAGTPPAAGTTGAGGTPTQTNSPDVVTAVQTQTTALAIPLQRIQQTSQGAADGINRLADKLDTLDSLLLRNVS